MKKIFYWMREQINGKIVKSPTNNEHWFRDECVRNNAYANAIDIIDEAEAKWEADCCEWKGKKNDMLGLYKTTCGNLSIVNPYWNFCPYCGKRIKISEVE